MQTMLFFLGHEASRGRDAEIFFFFLSDQDGLDYKPEQLVLKKGVSKMDTCCEM